MPHDLSISDVSQGAARYRARSAWSPSAAILICLLFSLLPLAAVFAFASVLGTIYGDAWVEMWLDGFGNLGSPQTLLIVIATQVMSLAIVLLAARKGGLARQTLQLERPQLTWPACLLAGLGLIVVTDAVELAMYFTVGFEPFKESQDILDGLRSPYWLGTVLVAVVLAPLWEELGFRGFLLSALAQSRLGFVWSGLLTNIVWTGLHFQYSVAGLISVFTAGLYLTWLIWRTGSMRAAIVAHAVGNASSLAFIGLFAPA